MIEVESIVVRNKKCTWNKHLHGVWKLRPWACCALSELNNLEWVTWCLWTYLPLSVKNKVTRPDDGHLSIDIIGLSQNINCWILLVCAFKNGFFYQSLHRWSSLCRIAKGFDVKQHAFSVIDVNYIFLALKSKNYLNCHFYTLQLGSGNYLKCSHDLRNYPASCWIWWK